MEQMKNPNEYREDGKLFIKKIKRCKCMRKDGDIYTVECHVIQRGWNNFQYQKEDGKIENKGSNKILWLGTEAKETLMKETAAFDSYVAATEKGEFSEIACEDAKFSLFFRPANNWYDFVLRYKNAKTGETTTEVFCDKSMDGILHYLQYLGEICESESKELFRNPTKANIDEHPVIIWARKNNDKKLEIIVKRHYHLETPKECSILAKILGIRILPPLPEEFDKPYVVDVCTMTDHSFFILDRSGYEILHRPYFAMMGSTHSKYTLNPHTKYGVDAAKVDSESISFDEFLELFEDGEEGE